MAATFSVPIADGAVATGEAVTVTHDEVREEFAVLMSTAVASLARAATAGKAAVAELDRLRARVAELEALADAVLRNFHERGHPGTPCIRTGWVREGTVQSWWGILRGGDSGE